jgi:hypothetical protein
MRTSLAGIAASLTIVLTLGASQPLETETARPLPKGMFKFEAAYELQRSTEGTERAFPAVIEYGITDRTEIAIEPVFGTSIRPKGAPAATGPGDIEVTLTHLFLPERGAMPAFAMAAEVKIPTANNTLIGTGRTDYAVYGIASKRLGRANVHGNLGYTVVGSPRGAQLNNIISYAVAEEFAVSPKFTLLGEILGNTSSTGDASEGQPGNTPTVPAEAAGAETVGLVGFRYSIRPSLFFALGVGYDNKHAFLIRPGITYRFGRR